MADTIITLPTLHPGQVRAFNAKHPSEYQLNFDPGFADVTDSNYKVIRCGRRWGKTDYLKTWVGDGAIKGWPCAIFAPDYKRMSEVYAELATMLKPITPRQGGANKTDGVIRLATGGRIDFWTLGDESAGRSRKYKRVAIDESAFTAPNMMDIWERAIEPTLLDLRGQCITASNTNGVDPSNFLWQVCHESRHKFIEVHEPSYNNPHVPGRLPWRTDEQHEEDRLKWFADLKARTPPLVFDQEYNANFVDWSGVAFFGIDKWLIDGRGVPSVPHCDRVFAVIDSAIKTGSDNDGTAVVYFARNQYSGIPLIILDWDIQQIEGDLLTSWVPGVVLPRLEELARQCGAREGSRGVWIEDKASGQVLIQHARRKGWPVHAIDSAFTALGKDERAISVSGYHYQEKIKITQFAHDKTTQYKMTTRNHLEGQVGNFRIGDKDAARRADDLLDAFVYGVSAALGSSKGF